MVRYTQEEKKKALRMYAAKESVRTIAEEIGCSTAIISQWARAAGLPVRSRGPKRSVPDATIIKARTLYEKGVSVAAIRRKFGWTVENARYYIFYASVEGW